MSAGGAGGVPGPAAERAAASRPAAHAVARAPEAIPARCFLHPLNPVAKLAAVLPALVGLFAVRDVLTPLAFAVLALAAGLAGSRQPARTVVTLLVGALAFTAVLTVSVAVWTDPVGNQEMLLRVGVLRVSAGSLLAGLATALRLTALLALVFLGAAGTRGGDLVRSLTAQLRVPYRFAHAALAAFRFVPRFRLELEQIRRAHRVRGAVAGRGPIAAVRRGLGTVVPLLAAALRHAERVAIAMDSRGFGAHRRRTERERPRIRARDVVYVAVAWAVTAAFFTAGALLG